MKCQNESERKEMEKLLLYIIRVAKLKEDLRQRDWRTFPLPVLIREKEELEKKKNFKIEKPKLEIETVKSKSKKGLKVNQKQTQIEKSISIKQAEENQSQDKILFKSGKKNALQKIQNHYRPMLVFYFSSNQPIWFYHCWIGFCIFM